MHFLHICRKFFLFFFCKRLRTGLVGGVIIPLSNMKSINLSHWLNSFSWQCATNLFFFDFTKINIINCFLFSFQMICSFAFSFTIRRVAFLFKIEFRKQSSLNFKLFEQFYLLMLIERGLQKIVSVFDLESCLKLGRLCADSPKRKTQFYSTFTQSYTRSFFLLLLHFEALLLFIVPSSVPYLSTKTIWFIFTVLYDDGFFVDGNDFFV